MKVINNFDFPKLHIPKTYGALQGRNPCMFDKSILFSIKTFIENNAIEMNEGFRN